MRFTADTVQSTLLKSIGHILVTGVPGSGKTIFASRLAEQIDYPVLHLDSIPDLWKADSVTRIIISHVNQYASDEAHVIEGHQILYFPEIHLKDFRVVVVDVDKDTAVQRLDELKRTGETEGYRRGEETNQETGYVVDYFLSLQSKFVRRVPDEQLTVVGQNEFDEKLNELESQYGRSG